ncbi:MAG: 50S ribosomal protein L14 [Promethearchaeota archaeon]|nr:MAG: 50S ribosomal protein L14 [Candidatus Lokiarchaeota archaeon]
MGKTRIRRSGALYLPYITKGVQNETVLKCADNSGGKKLRIISVVGYKGRLNKIPKASVGDMVVVSVIKGTPEMRRQVLRAIIIRQKKGYRRPEGTWIKFTDNAAIIVSPNGEPKGSEIRGAVAKEAAERWPRLSAVASMVV